MKYRVINVGTHANPPDDMYEKYFPTKLRHLAPRLPRQREFIRDGKFDCIELERRSVCAHPTQIGSFATDAAPVRWIKSFEEGNVGRCDVSSRLADMDRDGIDAEVIVHPGIPTLLPSNRETRWGMMYAFNSWLAEFCSEAPERLFGIGEIPLWNITGAVEEARRIAGLGLRGVLMPAVPSYVGAWSSPADEPYTSAVYRELWPVLEDLRLVLVVHADAAAAMPGQEKCPNPGLSMIINKTLPSEMIASLIVGHVFRDFPELKLVCVETGVGWMAQLIGWMDVLLREHPELYDGLAELPSETFRKHVGGSFLQNTGMGNHEVIDVNCIMWCSDPPRSYGRFPNWQKKIPNELDGLSEEDRHKILAGNAMRFFNIGGYDLPGHKN